MSFANYKKNKPDLSKMMAQVEKLADTKNKYKDDRFWFPTQDKAGNGNATVRFLPPAEGDNDELGWVQYYEHNFEENGNYFIHLCPTTLGRECPVCKSNKPLWKLAEQGDETAKKTVSDRKRKLHYISNLLILKDKDNPTTEGKVFLYRYGVKIFEKIINMLRPKDEDDPKVNVFDLWNGADFRLDIKKVKNFNNYDDSNFRPASPLYKGDDKQLEVVWNALHKISPFIAEDKIKSYEELEKLFIEATTGPAKDIKKKADEIFGGEKSAEPKKPAGRKPKAKDEDSAPWDEAVRKPSARATAKAPEVVSDNEDEIVEVSGDEDLDYYNTLVNQA